MIRDFLKNILAKRYAGALWRQHCRTCGCLRYDVLPPSPDNVYSQMRQIYQFARLLDQKQIVNCFIRGMLKAILPSNKSTRPSPPVEPQQPCATSRTVPNHLFAKLRLLCSGGLFLLVIPYAVYKDRNTTNSQNHAVCQTTTFFDWQHQNILHVQDCTWPTVLRQPGFVRCRSNDCSQRCGLFCCTHTHRKLPIVYFGEVALAPQAINLEFSIPSRTLAGSPLPGRLQWVQVYFWDLGHVDHLQRGSTLALPHSETQEKGAWTHTSLPGQPANLLFSFLVI